MPTASTRTGLADTIKGRLFILRYLEPRLALIDSHRALLARIGDLDLATGVDGHGRTVRQGHTANLADGGLILLSPGNKEVAPHDRNHQAGA